MLSLVKYVLIETPYEGKATSSEMTRLIKCIDVKTAQKILEQHYPTEQYEIYRRVTILDFSHILLPLV